MILGTYTSRLDQLPFKPIKAAVRCMSTLWTLHWPFRRETFWATFSHIERSVNWTYILRTQIKFSHSMKTSKDTKCYHLISPLTLMLALLPHLDLDLPHLDLPHHMVMTILSSAQKQVLYYCISPCQGSPKYLI